MLEFKHLNINIAIEEAKKYGFNQKIEINEKTKYFHFCWFGNNKMSELHLKCLNSWKEYLSNDYVLCLWNENCFDVESHSFVKNAYDDECWAFVSDYVRLLVIYEFGGVYFDTDVELLKPIDDLPDNFFCLENGFNSIATGLGFGSLRKNELILGILKEYDIIKYRIKHKWMISCPKITTNYFFKLGYKTVYDKINYFKEFVIYPSEYFSPINFKTHEIKMTDNTYSIHHYANSWN